ncbi:MAG: hypothetical protein JWM41_3086 [Gemmatimonadetes bacterium]|nr:hypothetical protein [Gemmatimonadota bacterium]
MDIGRRRALVALALCSACSKSQQRNTDTPAATASAPDPHTSATVTPDGYGPVRIGASLAQLSTAIGTNVPAARTADEKSCRLVFLGALPRGVRAMLVNDSVARIDVDAAGARTAEGAGVGDAESRVVKLYGGRATVTPHKYTGPVGHYVTVIVPGDSLRRLVFETDGQKILRFRAGRVPAVELVEGCA